MEKEFRGRNDVRGKKQINSSLVEKDTYVDSNQSLWKNRPEEGLGSLREDATVFLSVLTQGSQHAPFIMLESRVCIISLGTSLSLRPACYYCAWPNFLLVFEQEN